jgi:hypothetical protein
MSQQSVSLPVADQAALAFLLLTQIKVQNKKLERVSQSRCGTVQGTRTENVLSHPLHTHGRRKVVSL